MEKAGTAGTKERGDNEELMASYYEYHSERANFAFPRRNNIISRASRVRARTGRLKRDAAKTNLACADLSVARMNFPTFIRLLRPDLAALCGFSRFTVTCQHRRRVASRRPLQPPYNRPPNPLFLANLPCGWVPKIRRKLK